MSFEVGSRVTYTSRGKVSKILTSSTSALRGALYMEFETVIVATSRQIPIISSVSELTMGGGEFLPTSASSTTGYPKSRSALTTFDEGFAFESSLAIRSTLPSK